MLYNGSHIRCYDRDRMLLELAKHRNKLTFDYCREIVQSYRRLKDDLDFAKLDDYIDIMQSRTDFYGILQREIFLIKLADMINTYEDEGYGIAQAQAKAAQYVVIINIDASHLKNYVTTVPDI